MQWDLGNYTLKLSLPTTLTTVLYKVLVKQYFKVCFTTFLKIQTWTIVQLCVQLRQRNAFKSKTKMKNMYSLIASTLGILDWFLMYSCCKCHYSSMITRLMEASGKRNVGSHYKAFWAPTGIRFPNQIRVRGRSQQMPCLGSLLNTC